MEAAQKVDAALEPMSDEEAEFMVRHHGLIDSFLARSSTTLGISAAMVSSHLDNLKQTLVDIETLHQRTFDKHGKLKGDDFFAKRRQLMKQLDNSLGSLVRTGVGISNRSLVRHWSEAGTAGGIPGYATHIDGVSKASKVIKAGGWIGVGLEAGVSGLKVKETCRIGTEEACRKVKYTEAGKFAGSLGGGALGGLLASPVCLAIGVPTYGLGSVACVLLVSGLGATTFGTAGSDFGEFVGELVYEVTK